MNGKARQVNEGSPLVASVPLSQTKCDMLAERVRAALKKRPDERTLRFEVPHEEASLKELRAVCLKLTDEGFSTGVRSPFFCSKPVYILIVKRGNCAPEWLVRIAPMVAPLFVM
jgi:hypothetical protein